MADRKKDMIRIIDALSGRYSAYEIFTDWIRCMALSIQNTSSLFHDKVWKDNEQLYLDTMRKYKPDEQNKICELTALLVETLEEGPDDVLGTIYMQAQMGSKAAGQFFTPFHLSELCARVSLQDSIKSFDGKMTILINEPSCGGGGMIIAAAKVLKEAGIDYQKYLDVVAQDLDWKGVYMCYVQLSLLGISALCIQGDTLCDPYIPGKTERSHILVTPRKAGVLI